MINSKKRNLILVSCLVVIVLVFGLSVYGAERENILIGSVASTSGTYAYFASYAGVLNDYSEKYSATIVETGAGVENAIRLSKGDVDIALLTGGSAYLITQGKVERAGKIAGLRTLWVFSLNSQTTVVREESGVKNFTDLDGKKFAYGYRGSASETIVEQIATEILHIKPKVYRSGLTDLVAAFKDGRIVGFTKGGKGTNSLDSRIIEISTQAKVRILGYTEEQIKLIQEKFPFLFFVDVPTSLATKNIIIEPGTKTWPVVVLMGAMDSLSEEKAYELTKFAVEFNEEKMAKAFKGAAELSDIAKATLEYNPLYLHKGAIKYYKEIGVTIPDSMIPPEAR